LEAKMVYWDHGRFPRLHRIIFDNTLDQHHALELIKTGESRVDVVTKLRPIDTSQVAESPFASVTI
jgi:hypothetical protein